MVIREDKTLDTFDKFELKPKSNYIATLASFDAFDTFDRCFKGFPLEKIFKILKFDIFDTGFLLYICKTFLKIDLVNS
jgi:hypothetical protein